MLLDTSSFWHPAIGHSALERNYREGLKNNQRKGAGTVAVCPLLAQLPPYKRQSRDVQPSHHLGPAGPLFHSRPQEPACPGLLPANRKSHWELGMHALWMMAQLPAGPGFDNPSHPTWTLALGSMFVRMPVLRRRSSMAPRGRKATQVCLTLPRHGYTNVVKLPTWVAREPEESEEEPGGSPSQTDLHL